MYSRTLEARHTGSVEIDLEGYDANIEITADPNCQRATVELYTDASTGTTVEAIDKLRLTETGRTVQLRLPEEAGGGVQVNSFGGGSYSSVSIGRGNRGIVIGGSGGVIMTGGNADMNVNGQRIQVRGGRTYVNGVLVNGAGPGLDPGEPARPIHIRATVPAGSTGRAKTYNGSIATVDLPAVRLTSYNGNVQATGVTTDSRLKSYNGSLTVGARSGARPAVQAETYNGDIRALDDDVRLRPKTYNGQVRYPR
jgi:hypothetical protein